MNQVLNINLKLNTEYGMEKFKDRSEMKPDSAIQCRSPFLMQRRAQTMPGLSSLPR